MKFSKEQIEKAAQCKNVEELISLAKTEGIELTKEEAEKYFAQLKNKALNLDDVADVAGGCTGNACAGNVSAVC